MVSLTKQSNIKAFFELFISMFRLTCELILGTHVGIVLIQVLIVVPIYRCCEEILECMAKFTYDGKDAECIIQHWAILYYAPNTRTVYNRKSSQQAELKTGKMSKSN